MRPEEFYVDAFEGAPKRQAMRPKARPYEATTERDYTKAISPKDKTRITDTRIFNRKTNNPIKKSHLKDLVAEEVAVNAEIENA